jgi:plasmid stabilization system protein ParE
MSRALRLRNIARHEFDEAADWYEKQRPGLGLEFVEEVDRVLDDLREFPEAHAVVHKDLREALVHRFPYAVYYRVEPEQVVVVAIIHTARNPATWQRRN